MTANSTALSIQISDSFFQPPPTPISRDTTPNTTKEEGSARYSLDLRDFSNAAADFEVDDCGFDDRSAHRLRGSIIIPIRPYFHIRNDDSDGQLQFPNSDSGEIEHPDQFQYEPLQFPSSDSDEPLQEGQLNRSVECMPNKLW